MIIFIVISVVSEKTKKLDTACDNAIVERSKPIVVRHFDKKLGTKTLFFDENSSEKTVYKI